MKFMQKSKNIIIWLVLLVVLAGIFIFSLFMGRYMVSPAGVLKILWHSLRGLPQDSMDASVVMNIRLPRTILALLVGAGLATAGAAYQGLFQNPLVSPDVLGTSAGAAFGAVLGILLSGMDYRAMALSVIFGLLSVVLVFLLSMLSGQTTVISLVLSGMIVQALMNALISLSKYVADPTEKLPAITYWLMGSFISANYGLLKLVTIPILLGIAVIFALRWRINVLSMGDEECISLGIDPVKTRGAIIIACTLITAASVMATGVIGWVGLVIPHIARMLVGVDHNRLVPASALTGGAFMILVDVLARSITDSELPIGILTALIGAPFFAVLFWKRGK